MAVIDSKNDMELSVHSFSCNEESTTNFIQGIDEEKPSDDSDSFLKDCPNKSASNEENVVPDVELSCSREKQLCVETEFSLLTDILKPKEDLNGSLDVTNACQEGRVVSWSEAASVKMILPGQYHEESIMKDLQDNCTSSENMYKMSIEPSTSGVDTGISSADDTTSLLRRDIEDFSSAVSPPPPTELPTPFQGTVISDKSNGIPIELFQNNAGNSVMQHDGILQDSYISTSAVSGFEPSALQVHWPPQTPVLVSPKIEGKDPLETLANAALGSQVSVSEKIKEGANDKEPVWHDVGIFRGTSCHVKSYFSNPSQDTDHNYIASDNLPDFSNSMKTELQPGTAYRFRVCAVNSCGRGPWSPSSAFRTSLPGYPGAPSSVSISRSGEGAHLSWQPPSNPSGNIVEYTVLLAVKNPPQILGSAAHTGHKLNLMKVYSGPRTYTVVSNACLSEALIDTTAKPAIIFRIAARNEKGFGPPTQVRWLQDLQ